MYGSTRRPPGSSGPGPGAGPGPKDPEAARNASWTLRCVECAAVAAPAALRWVTLAELEEVGYGFVLPEGGCGRPDCGGGRCGLSRVE